MEMQRPKTKQKKVETQSKQLEIKQPEIKPILSLNPLFPEHIFTVTTPMRPRKQSHPPQPAYIEPQQPIWQPIDDVIQASYRGEQTKTCSAVELQPVYKQTNKSDEQEKKSLLRTNSLRPNTELMQELFDTTAYFVTDEKRNNNLQQDLRKNQFVIVIENMNNARNNNINEDLMGQFTYNNKKGFEGTNYEIIDSLFPLFFLLLKKYTSTVSQTGEQLPLHFKKTRLKDILNPESHINTSCNNAAIPNAYSDLDTYPAFFKLIHATRYAVEQLSMESINSFIDYVYGNKSIPFHNYSQTSYKDLKNEFYTKAYYFLIGNNNDMQTLYDLIQMIDTAKNNKDINTENDLAEGILGFEPDLSGVALLASWFEPTHYVKNIKKRIALFCLLVRQYNNKRLTKITPTLAQYHVYTVQKSLDLPVLENSLFDENVYALAEFVRLYKGTELLRTIMDEDTIDTYFKTYYPQKK